MMRRLITAFVRASVTLALTTLACAATRRARLPAEKP